MTFSNFTITIIHHKYNVYLKRVKSIRRVNAFRIKSQQTF